MLEQLRCLASVAYDPADYDAVAADMAALHLGSHDYPDDSLSHVGAMVKEVGPAVGGMRVQARIQGFGCRVASTVRV